MSIPPWLEGRVNINWWRFGRGALGLAAVAMMYPLAQNVLLLLRQIDATNESNIMGVMLGQGGGGTPGLEHSSSAVLDLVVSGCLLATAIGLLCVLERLHAPVHASAVSPGAETSEVEPAARSALRKRWDRAWSTIRKTARDGYSSLAILVCLTIGLLWILIMVGSCVVDAFVE